MTNEAFCKGPESQYLRLPRPQMAFAARSSFGLVFCFITFSFFFFLLALP